MNEKLTTIDFWEQFWGQINLPAKVDFNFKNDKIISDVLFKYVKASNPEQTSLEIGCAPGKWMIYSAEYLGYRPAGVEYVHPAARATEKNLKLCNVDGKVWTDDFFTFKPEEQFDLVTSFGFIEHFENYRQVFLRHVEMAKKEGHIAIFIPRFRGINYLIQSLIDPYMERPYLVSHHLPIMELEVFKKLADENKLTLVYNEYIGGFEPSLFPVGEIKNPFVKFFTRGLMKLFSIFFGNMNGKTISSFEVAIYKK